MFELLVTLCLHSQPAVCAERLLPQPEPVSEALCVATAEERAGLWLQSYPELRLASWRCLSREAWVAEHRDFSVEEIAPGVFVHQGRVEVFTPENAGDIANIGFVVGDQAVAVIDTGGSRQVAEGLLAAIWQQTDLPVAWLILTHMHPDHVMGASLFQEAGARIIGHAKLPAALASRVGTYQDNMARLLGGEAVIASKVVLPEETVEDRLELDLGGRILELQAHKTAHSDNDLTVLDLESATWWLSDLLFVEHTPVIDGSLTGWLALLEEMAEREVARIVPGHGQPNLPWPEGGEAQRAYLTGLAEETRRAIARGDSMGSAIELLGKGLEGNWLLFEEYNPRNATAAYKELEWE